MVVITDPGPDPDDAKVILLLGIAHLGRQISLRAVVCNGGAQARERAGLARCLLDHIGAQRVPVGIGSAGSPTSARPHEFNLPGYAEVDPARLLDGSELLRSALRRSSRKSVRLLCIASMRDAADLFEREPALVFSRLQRVVIQGGLQRDEATGSWVADSAVNNGFDMQAANAVYAACQQSGLPMTVVSRHAVPLLPMQLANSFALRTECPVMRYLADAQSLGLRGLWSKLCAGQLPARCTKQWYFEVRSHCPLQEPRNRQSSWPRRSCFAPYLSQPSPPPEVRARHPSLPLNPTLLPGPLPWPAPITLPSFPPDILWRRCIRVCAAWVRSAGRRR